jgi:hypothetical protein
MKPKNLLAVALLVFVLVALGWALLKPNEVVEEVVASVDPAIADGVVAYYLHPEQRCATCLKIEELAKMAIEDNFPEDLEAGRLQWLPLNVDEPANAHYMDDFELHTTSLVLAERRSGAVFHYTNCTRVWELVHSPMQFDMYVAGEITSMLGAI